jgi:hypothetical protein
MATGKEEKREVKPDPPPKKPAITIAPVKMDLEESAESAKKSSMTAAPTPVATPPPAVTTPPPTQTLPKSAPPPVQESKPASKMSFFFAGPSTSQATQKETTSASGNFFSTLAGKPASARESYVPPPLPTPPVAVSAPKPAPITTKVEPIRTVLPAPPPVQKQEELDPIKAAEEEFKRQERRKRLRLNNEFESFVDTKFSISMETTEHQQHQDSAQKNTGMGGSLLGSSRDNVLPSIRSGIRPLFPQTTKNPFAFLANKDNKPK